MRGRQELIVLFRKVWKPVLVLLLATGILFSVCLLFLHFYLDGISIRYIEKYYQSVARVIRNAPDHKDRAEYQEYQTIDPEVIRLLRESDCVQNLEVRQTVSARMQDQLMLNSRHMFPRTNMFIVYKARVDKERLADGGIASEDPGEYYPELNLDPNLRLWYQSVRMEELLAGLEDQEVLPPFPGTLHVYTDQEYVEPSFEYLSIAMPDDKNQNYLMNQYRTNILKGDPYVLWKMMDNGWESLLPADSPYLKLFYRRGFVPLEDTEGVREIEAVLPWYRKEIQALDHVVTARLVGDMQLIFPVANEEMFLTQGRWITPEDYNRNVCVISYLLAQRNFLRVGDTLPLGLSNDRYVIQGYESGYPLAFQELKSEYGPTQPYEVVGIYRNRNMAIANHPELYDFNDVFIPKREGVSPPNHETPYTVSFQIGVWDGDRFESEVEPAIEARGYRVQRLENRWSQVQSQFESMRRSRVRNILYALLLLFGGVCILNPILLSLFRTDYVIRRIYAGPIRHINRAYQVPLWMALICGHTLCLGLLLLVYPNILASHLKLIPETQMPGVSMILLVACGTLLVVDLVFVLSQWICLKYLRRKSILELMR